MKIKSSIPIVLLGIMCLFLSGCTPRHKVHRSVMHTHEQPRLDDHNTITVWIHGTQFVRNILGSVAFNGIPSLQPMSAIKEYEYLYSLGKGLTSFYKNKASDFIYFFGWNGQLNTQSRQEAAQILYTSLLQLVNNHTKQYGKKPRIRLVTHSHGGNVALNMALFAPATNDLLIDELIMLACPVQAINFTYINHPLFKKIYALFSSLDIVQVIAPQFTFYFPKKPRRYYKQSNMPRFSSRFFPPSGCAVNVKIRIDGRSILHSEFNRGSFVCLLPHIINEIDRWGNDACYEPYRVLSLRRCQHCH